MRSFSNFNSIIRIVLPTVLIPILSVFAAGQSSIAPEVAAVNPIEKRIERARALAAAHQLQAAATELENVRASVNDVALRNVTSLMLLGIYLEEGTYGRAQSLLEEAFQVRAAHKDDSVRTYFALAGQAINGVRSHLARYRSFGINPGDSGLPAEAVADLDHLRNLLERMIAQAREISSEDSRAYDVLSLQEDVLGLRVTVARDNSDREKWQTEYTAAREQLAGSQIQVASLARPPALAAVTAKIPNPFANTKPVDNSDKTSGTLTESAANSTFVAPTQPDAAEPKLISTGSLSGRESKRVTPLYPQQARKNGVSGTVRVFVIVDEKGKVWVTGSEGSTLLRQAAEEAARNWNFAPTLVSGKPVRVAGYIDFDFKL